MRKLLVSSMALLLAACATAPITAPPPPPSRPPGQVQQPPPTQPPPPAVGGFRSVEIMRGPGLAGVIEERAGSLIQQFGTPRLDVAEGDMRKLQFSASACVLDIFLYPLRPNGEPVATWLEARRASDGAEVDYLACMQALRQSR